MFDQIDLSDSLNFFNPIDTVKDLQELLITTHVAKRLDDLSREFNIKALYFDSGILLVDTFTYDNHKLVLNRFIEQLSLRGISVLSVNIAPTEEVLRLIQDKLAIEKGKNKEVELAETIQQVNKLMEHVVKVDAEDLFITCSKSQGISFAQFKCKGALLPGTYSLKDYEFGLSVCRTLYDGGASAGKTSGSFDEVSMQEKQITHMVHDRTGALKAKLSLRYIKIPTKRAGELVINMRVNKGARLLDELGLKPDVYKVLKQKISNSKGGIITSGPTGSGKSTTMFAGVLELPKDKKIFSFEDPIEIEAPEGYQHFHQISMDRDTSIQMKAINRMNPDAVFVQELRDHDSAAFAFKMMISGITVLTTTHATSVVGVIERLLNLGIPLEEICTDKVLSLLMSQALVGQVCKECCFSLNDIRQSKPNYFREISDKAKRYGVTLNETMSVRNRKGCSSCQHTGIASRQIFIDYADVTDADRAFILKKDFQGWKQHLLANGFIPLEQQIYRDSLNGSICVEDMLGYF